MILLPYKTALSLNRLPKVSYAVVLICVVVYYLQVNVGLTDAVLYYPEKRNPFKMVSAAFAHADLSHIFFNLLFFLAFAPALETLVDNAFRFILLMLFIAVVSSLGYSLSIAVGGSESLPALGLSGVVMGMIGLSAYLMPNARIRVWFGLLYLGKSIYPKVWLVALFYIGGETWDMLTLESYGNIGIVAHVAGGFTGYFYGVFWFKDRKEDTHEELEEEIKAQSIIRKRFVKLDITPQREKELDVQKQQRQEQKEFDQWMMKLHHIVSIGDDSRAVLMVMDKYDETTPAYVLEVLFIRIEQWRPSRTLMCVARMRIHQLEAEQQLAKVLPVIERCQNKQCHFLLPDMHQLPQLIVLANDSGFYQVAEYLEKNPCRIDRELHR